MGKPVDLLLLNASNSPRFPLYPYAFVQVTAIARRHGLRVARHDLFGLPVERWPAVLEHLLDRHAPRMIGIHLRNLDSLVDGDYHSPDAPQYLPAETTRGLIDVLRTLTSAPIVVGGFGFTTNAMNVARYLQPDYGLQGEPDDFFTRFEDIVAGRGLPSVANLIYRDADSYRANPRVYFDPAPEPEYDDELLAELKQFYGAPSLHMQTVAVEIARGCPFLCYFCSEPQVKGQRFRRRDLDVVFEDVERILRNDLLNLFFVCSEINVIDSSFALEVAERMVKVRERYKSAPIRWTAYNLPTMTDLSDLRALVRSGYMYSWNDAQSLDDENLKMTKVPYRSRHVVKYLKNVMTLEEEMGPQAPPPTGVFAGKMLTLFLGNAFAGPETVTRTLQMLSEERLAQRFDMGFIMRATRLFERDGGPICGQLGEALIPPSSLRKRPHDEYPDYVLPTFYYPERLVEALGSLSAYHEFLSYVGDTFMSRRHVATKRWPLFLANYSSPERLCKVIADIFSEGRVPGGQPDPMALGAVKAAAPMVLLVLCPEPSLSAMRELFLGNDDMELVMRAPSNLFAAPYNAAARAVAKFVYLAHLDDFAPVLDYLGLPREGAELPPTDYDIARVLYSRYSSNDTLLSDVSEKLALDASSVQMFCLRKYLYDHNVRIRREYGPLLFGPEIAAS